MHLPHVPTLDPEARAAIRPDARRMLAYFRGNATARTRERARLLVEGLALTGMLHGGDAVAV